MRPAIRTTLVYGLISALAAIPAAGLLAGLIGRPPAFRLVLWADLLVYALLLCRWSGRGPERMLLPLALLLGAAVWPGVDGLYLFLWLGVLAWIRSGVCFAATPLRSVVAEAVAVAGGAGLIALLNPDSAVAWAVALWLFFLVQALYFFIVPAPVRGEAVSPPEDPFERASRGARRVLEQ